MTTDARPIAIALAGDGAEADAWARALRGSEGASVERVSGGEDALLSSLSMPGIDAMAFVAPVPDLAGSIKRAMLAGRHVLVAGQDMLTSQQLMALAELSARRGRCILFDGGAMADEQLAFVRKMTAGPNALWRPRYLRALHMGGGAEATLDAIALVEVRRVLAVTAELPETVSAFSPRVDDESGAADVALMTLTFASGTVARLDISLVESMPQRELVIACDGRTIIVDALDRDTPLRIVAGGRHRGPSSGGSWAETVSEHPVAAGADRLARAADSFVAAVREGGADASNAADAARAALVWERARQSMSCDGEPVAIGERGLRVRPILELIEGGGRSTPAASASRLTLVGRN